MVLSGKLTVYQYDELIDTVKNHVLLHVDCLSVAALAFASCWIRVSCYGMTLKEVLQFVSKEEGQDNGIFRLSRMQHKARAQFRAKL